jgi:pimeloyl-ACP methyl ester carboxylesterase
VSGSIIAVDDAQAVRLHGRVTTSTVTVTDEYALLNGLRLHFRDWVGPAGPDGPLLVLLHGFSVHARSWDPFAPAFTTRYRVLALDARGHGESQWAPDGAYGIEQHVSDVVALLRALGRDRVSIVGISMGGRTAYNLAAADPDLVERLVIVDIGPTIMATGAQRIQSTVSGVDRFASVDAAVDAFLQSTPGAPIGIVRERVRNNLMLCDDGMLTWRYDVALRRGPIRRPPADDQWALLEKITAPTLILHGSRSDVLSREDAEQMQATIPQAHLAEIADAGHSIAVEQPAPFLGAITAFLLG